MSERDRKTALAQHTAPVRRTVIVSNQYGLHARPAAWLVKTINQFEANVTVGRTDSRVNGGSMLGLLTLGAGYGTKLTLSATGKDAVQVLDAIERLLAGPFEEAYQLPREQIIIHTTNELLKIAHAENIR